MSIAYRVDRLAQRILVTVHGPVTLDDLTDYVMERLANDVLGLDQLFDARNADLKLSPDQITLWIEREYTALRGNRPGSIALVASDGATYGHLRMIQTLIELAGVHSAVFRDIETAERWLTVRRAMGEPPEAKGGVA